MNKTNARQIAKDFRSKFTTEELYEFSLMITYRLCYVKAFKEAFNYHIFVGSLEKGEIATKPLIEVLLNSGRDIFVPKVYKDGKLSHHQIKSITDLQEGKFGIEEPLTEPTDKKQFDCIIIPMLAADIKGNRVGYGKGFYDRMLEEIKGVKIGLIFDQCLFDKIEIDDFDIPMDYIVTEKRALELNID